MTCKTKHDVNSECEQTQQEGHPLQWWWKVGTPDKPTQKMALEIKRCSAWSYPVSACCNQGGRSSVSNCDLILDMKTVFHNVDLVFTSGSHDHCVLQSSNLSDAIYRAGKREREVLKAEEVTFQVWAELSFMTNTQKTAAVNNSATQSPGIKSGKSSFK